MVKKISVLALAGLLALPALASAGAGGAAGTADVQAQVDALTKQLNALKAQMADIKTTQDQKFESFDAKSEKWDMASRIQFSGDFRARGDYYSADTKGYMPFFIPSATATNLFGLVPNDGTTTGGRPVAMPDASYRNNSDFTNRFRLDMRAKALENVEFKGRLAMYKTWGMQNDPLGAPEMGGTALWDGNASRQPNDSILRVDRAFVNWNNIGGVPVWFSIGRRPTTDGPPTQMRMNSDERIATPTAVMDYPFDGVSIGYAYNNLFGIPDAPGRVRFCWGRGFEAGLNQTDTGANQGINDTDFAGMSWDIYKKGNRFAYIQSFAAMDLMNYPSFSDAMTNQFYDWAMGGRKNIGNLYHTSGVYQDKWQNLNYFGMLGWSRTDPNDQGMMNFAGSMTAPPSINTTSENGYVMHVGVRYDIPDSLFKFGAEYNHGSKYWVGLTPGNDDLYSAGKLSTRGNVYEVYGIYDIPGGEAVSKYGKAFMRLGYQHYDYNYTGSGDWNMMPVKMDDTATSFQLAPPVESADQVYLTFEATF